jgi:hypothetical protein
VQIEVNERRRRLLQQNLPEAAVSRCSKLRRYHFVGEQLDRIGHLKPKRLGCLHIDNKLELGRLLDRQVGRLRALENLTGVDTNLTPHAQIIGPVAHQPTGLDLFASGMGRWNPVARC